MGLAPHGKARRAVGLPPLRGRGLLRSASPPAGARFCANPALSLQRARRPASPRAAPSGRRRPARLRGRTTRAGALAAPQKPGPKNLCFAGGTALNCSANERLLRESPVPPRVHSTGAQRRRHRAGLRHLWPHCSGRQCPATTAGATILGPEPARADIEAALADAADLQVEHIGDAGHFAARSCRAAVPAEGGRPVSGTQRIRSARPWATAASWATRATRTCVTRSTTRSTPNGSARCTGRCSRNTPAILRHPPGLRLSCSLPRRYMQDAGPHDSGHYPRRLHRAVGTVGDPTIPSCAHCSSIRRRSGVPVLLNTSFNGKDEPIVETPAEALAASADRPCTCWPCRPTWCASASSRKLWCDDFGALIAAIGQRGARVDTGFARGG